MRQTGAIIFIICFAFVIFIFFKINKEKSKNIVKIFFATGLIFILIGCVFDFFLYDHKTIMSSLLLHSNEITQRLFHIGYSSLLSSFFFLIDSFVTRKRKG